MGLNGKFLRGATVGQRNIGVFSPDLIDGESGEGDVFIFLIQQADFPVGNLSQAGISGGAFVDKELLGPSLTIVVAEAYRHLFTWTPLKADR